MKPFSNKSHSHLNYTRTSTINYRKNNLLLLRKPQIYSNRLKHHQASKTWIKSVPKLRFRLPHKFSMGPILWTSKIFTCPSSPCSTEQLNRIQRRLRKHFNPLLREVTLTEGTLISTTTKDKFLHSNYFIKALQQMQNLPTAAHLSVQKLI